MALFAMFARTRYESFRPPFSKGGTDPTPWGVGRRPQTTKHLYRPKAPEGGASPLWACGGNHKWGFPLLCCTSCRGKSREIFTARPRDFGAARCRKKGKNHKWGFSLFSPAEKIHPFRALSDDKGVSPSAEGDQRPTALDPCRFLKKAGKNFQKGFVRT